MTPCRILTVLALAMMACVLGRVASAALLATAFDGLTFDRATSIQQVRGNPSRWFVAERGGVIQTFSTNNLAAGASVALNISSYLQYTDTRPGNTDSQQWGITSIAPSLSFRTNGYMYVARSGRDTWFQAAWLGEARAVGKVMACLGLQVAQRGQSFSPLATNDGHGFFEALGDAVITGPTLTDVNDFRAILVTSDA